MSRGQVWREALACKGGQLQERAFGLPLPAHSPLESVAHRQGQTCLVACTSAADRSVMRICTHVVLHHLNY